MISNWFILLFAACSESLNFCFTYPFQQLKTADLVFHSIPAPTQAHCNVLTRMLEAVTAEQGLDAKGMEERAQLADKIGTLLKGLVPGKTCVTVRQRFSCE